MQWREQIQVAVAIRSTVMALIYRDSVVISHHIAVNRCANSQQVDDSGRILSNYVAQVKSGSWCSSI